MVRDSSQESNNLESDGGQSQHQHDFDLVNAPMEAVFEQLQSSREGLTSEEAAERLIFFGENKLEEKKENPVLKFLGFLWNPLAWVMEAAALVSLILANGQGKPPDWPDFLGIVFLLILNATLSFWEENNAGKAARALMAHLAPIAKTRRDGEWKEIDASQLVPGDIVSIRGGDIVPADCRLLHGEPLKIDQSALTGESLPVNKYPGDEVYSGSVCKQGELQGLVIATGLHTFFGKAAHLVSSTQHQGHFQKVLAKIGSFCIAIIFVGIFVEIIVMYSIQKRPYREGINNVLVLLIGGIPIAMPAVLSITMAIGAHRLADQGAIVKRMTAIEEMAGMDILCCDKTGTLTLNKLSVDVSMTRVFTKGLNKSDVLLLAARASRVDHPDPIDSAILNTLEDPSMAREGIKELHFLPFNPIAKRAAITYQLQDERVERVCKGAPEQVLNTVHNMEVIKNSFHEEVENFASRGLRSLAVAIQRIPEGPEVGAKGEGGGIWEMVGLLPLFDPPRHDTAETIDRALELGVAVKMITGDQLAIGKETARRLGMGTNLYPTALLTDDSHIPIGTSRHDIVENADGFAGVFPEHKYYIVQLLQERNHITAMTGDGVNDAPALKKANIGIAVAGATDAARDAADIVLTQPGLRTIITAIMRARVIFQRMKNYTIYAISITVRIVVGFLLLALIWQFDFPPFMVLIIAILNDGTIMTISKDRVRPSQVPDSWRLREIFTVGVVLGLYLAFWTVMFYYAITKGFFASVFHVDDLNDSYGRQTAAVYLQVSIISQALIFVTRSQTFSFMERPGFLLFSAFVIAQLIATLLAVYANWGFVPITGIGWKWAGVIWLYDLIVFVPLDFLKLLTRYVMEGNAWDLLTERKAFFTRAKNYGQRDRQAQWAAEQRSAIEGRSLTGTPKHSVHRPPHLPEVVMDAMRRAEIAQIQSRYTLRGHIESLLQDKAADMSWAVDKAYSM